jgi:microcystin-dependent protein
MANYEATRYDYTGANLQNIEGVNTGIIVPWGDASIPSGFLECNGSDVSRTTYAALFAVIGTTYGSGNGSTTFTLPDLQDDCCVGTSPTKAVASTGGANTVAPTGNVTGSLGNHTLTTPELASHDHVINTGLRGSSGGSNRNLEGTSSSAGGGGAHDHAGGGSVTGDSNSVLQPYITLIYIIKT